MHLQVTGPTPRSSGTGRPDVRRRHVPDRRYAGGMIDAFVPVAEVASRHTVTLAAAPARVYEVIRTVDLARSRVIRTLFALRGLRTRRPLTIESLQGAGFVLLRAEPDRGIVLGITGRFWTLRGGLRRIEADRFAAFAEPGYGKAAWSITVEPDPTGGSVVATETRVAITDEPARRAFRRYWRLVGPFSGIIRRRMLALVATECTPAPPPR